MTDQIEASLDGEWNNDSFVVWRGIPAAPYGAWLQPADPTGSNAKSEPILNMDGMFCVLKGKRYKAKDIMQALVKLLEDRSGDL